MKIFSTALATAFVFGASATPAMACNSFGFSCGPIVNSEALFTPPVRSKAEKQADQFSRSGFVHLKDGRYDYAAVLFEKAADKSIASAKANYMAGATNYLLRDDDKAEIYLARALRGRVVSGLSTSERKIARNMLIEIRTE